jgi:hypothetical protein
MGLSANKNAQPGSRSSAGRFCFWVIERRVIVPGVVIQEPGAVLFLAGEGAVGV